MKKLIKGSKQAKEYMAKIRAKRKKVKPTKIGAFKVVEKNESKNTRATKNLKVTRRSDGTFKKYTKIAGIHKDTKSHNVKISVMSGYFDTAVLKELDSLKKQYLKLAKKYHPDAGGTTIQFQELKNEYEKLLHKILSGSKLDSDQQKNEIVIDENIRAIIDSLINIENITVELIGKWLWIGGDTFPVKEVFKSSGLAPMRKGKNFYWVYKGIESAGRGKLTMEQIRNKYGSQNIEIPKSKKISGLHKKINKAKLKTSLKKLKNALNKRLA